MTFGDGISRKDNSFEYYVQDHLGSTRAVMVEDGVSGLTMQEAMAYVAYGAQKPLLEVATADNKAREQFTGKEFDEDGGIDLGYWGARYYDPEIGYWITTDRQQQFWSSYSYTGNCFNPVNAFDNDGRYVVYAVHSGGRLIGYRIKFETASEKFINYIMGFVPGPTAIGLAGVDLLLETQQLNDPNIMGKTIALGFSLFGLRSITNNLAEGAQTVNQLARLNYRTASYFLSEYDKWETINAFRGYYGYELFKLFQSIPDAIDAISNLFNPTTVSVSAGGDVLETIINTGSPLEMPPGE